MQEKISIKFPEDYIKEFIEGIVTLLNELEKSLIDRNINIHKCIESDTNIKRNL